MGEETAISEYADEVKVQRLLAVLERQVQTGCSVRAACQALSLPERTFYAWVGEGLLKDYLADARTSRQTAAQAQAIEAMPDVLAYMVALATGRREARGANPVAAARWLAEMAGMAAPESGHPPAQLPGAQGTTILAYIPQMAIVDVRGGKVVTDEQGRIRAITSAPVDAPPPNDTDDADTGEIVI